MISNGKIKNALTILPLVLCYSLSLTRPAFSDDENLPSKGGSNPGEVVSIEALDSGGHGKEFSLGTTSTYADRNGNNLEQAISLCHKALEKDDDDIDLHEHYAELLEQKFHGQEKPDPSVYMDCVKEWLIVLRNEAGDEKGQTFHGIGIPFSGEFYRDEGREVLAKRRLVSLTGVAPKGWETDANYLKRVSKHASVGAKILPKIKAEAKADASM